MNENPGKGLSGGGIAMSLRTLSQEMVASGRRYGPLPRELAVFAMGCISMALLYFLPAGAWAILLATGAWLAFSGGVLRVVGRERFPEFFLWCFFFFPKKTVAADWWGGLLAGHFGGSSPVVLSFFDVVLLPTLVITGLWLYRRSPSLVLGRWYSVAAMVFAFFTCAGALNYILSGGTVTVAYAPIVVGGSIATAACYLLLKILGHRPAVSGDVFPRYAKWLVVLLFLEYLVASLPGLPESVLRFSMDYRGGFRSAWLGYSVLVAFFAMLGFLFAVRDYLDSSRSRDLASAFMALTLMLATFERAALLASALFVVVLVFLDVKHRRYGLLLAAFVLSLMLVEYRNTWNAQFKEVTAASISASTEKQASALSISKIKGGRALSTDSMPERFALQLRAVDVFVDAPLTGYGAYSYFMTSVSAVTPVMRAMLPDGHEVRSHYENIINGGKQSNTHNAFAQVLAEAGMGVIAFAGFALIIPFILIARDIHVVREFRGTFMAPVSFLLVLHVYYFFQSSPTYYFLFVIPTMMMAHTTMGEGETCAA